MLVSAIQQPYSAYAQHTSTKSTTPLSALLCTSHSCAKAALNRLTSKRFTLTSKGIPTKRWGLSLMPNPPVGEPLPMRVLPVA